jgi:Protein of unknown function (DUF642)/PEP-CTERM motif
MKKYLAIAAVAVAPVFAQASTIFSDNFDANTAAGNAVPNGWTVSNGTVDIVGAGFFSQYALSGNSIDLDGSSGDAGVLSRSFSLIAGNTYTALFDLSGNQRGGSERVTVTFGSSVFTFSNLKSNTPWSTYEIEFTPTASQVYTLSFANAGGDNIGAVLDNVTVTAVPEPETFAMLLAGLGLMGAVVRRRKANQA